MPEADIRSVSAVTLDYTVIDFETTGVVDDWPSEPWQIGMVRMEQGRLAESPASFDRLLRVDAARPFNPHVPGRHQLLRAEIARADTLHEIWDELQPWWRGRPLVAHNISVEKKYLTQSAPMHAFGPWVDTLKLARLVYPGLPGYRLGELVQTLQLSPRLATLCPAREAHDALYDAFASALLLEHFLSLPGWKSAPLADLL